QTPVSIPITSVRSHGSILARYLLGSAVSGLAFELVLRRSSKPQRIEKRKWDPGVKLQAEGIRYHHDAYRPADDEPVADSLWCPSYLFLVLLWYDGISLINRPSILGPGGPCV